MTDEEAFEELADTMTFAMYPWILKLDENGMKPMFINLPYGQYIWYGYTGYSKQECNHHRITRKCYECARLNKE